ncbi:hypothetical protein MBLNU459_g5671t1 [Dothideomycetes sp. NU459]
MSKNNARYNDVTKDRPDGLQASDDELDAQDFDADGIPLEPLRNHQKETDIERDDSALPAKDTEPRYSDDASDDEDGIGMQSFELYTPDEERRVLKKLDTKLVLFVAVLYMLSFLDRSNIGNAKVAGMSTDLGLTTSQFEWLLSGFYITYVLFEWMTLLYRVIPPHIYISVCVFAWGMLASLQSVSTGFTSMFIIRTLLGISEAAFGPGVPFYLSFFYRRHELAFRTGLFISAAPLASSFASTLAYGIVRLGDNSRVQSWRLLFLVEGFPSVIVAVWAWYWIPDSPETTHWLGSRERRVAGLRLRRNDEAYSGRGQAPTGSGRLHSSNTGLKWKEIGKTLKDPKSYITAAMFFSCNVAFSSMPVFSPVIIEEMGYSSLAAQALSAPPHLAAFVVVLVTAILSDRYRTRSIPVAIHAVLAMGGYTLLALASPLSLPNALRYLCIFPITAGFFSCVCLVIVWTVNNQQSDEGKGTGIALMNIIGQLGPLLGTRLYPDADGPFYTMGHSLCAGSMGLVAVLAIALRIVLQRANSKLGSDPGSVQSGAAYQPLTDGQTRRLERNEFQYIL